MERVISFRDMPWEQSVFSVMREKQLNAAYTQSCREGKMLISGAAGARPLGKIYYPEAPLFKGKAQTEDDYIRDNLENDIYCIGAQEENLLTVLLMGEGSVPFVMPMAPAAEGLIRRGWCSVEQEKACILRLREGFYDPIMAVFQSPAFHVTRRMVFRLEAIVYSLVFIYGYANMEFTANMICDAVSQTGMAMNKWSFFRAVRGYAEYCRTGDGTEYLIHPALRDPERLITQGLGMWDGGMAVTIQNLEGGMNACLPQEREAVEAANRFVGETARQDADAEHLSENLYYMFKQGATETEAALYLQPKMAVSAQRRMHRVLLKLKEDVIPWGQDKGGRVN